MEPATLENKLCLFIVETSRQDGARYPARMLYGIIAGIQYFDRQSGRHEITFLNIADPTFGSLHQVLDARMKERTSKGVGMVTKQAQVISKDEEELLWLTCVFNINSAQGLPYLVFFYNCKLFGLRGGDEHQELCCQEFVMQQEDMSVSWEDHQRM